MTVSVHPAFAARKLEFERLAHEHFSAREALISLATAQASSWISTRQKPSDSFLDEVAIAAQMLAVAEQRLEKFHRETP